jgi:hypothetical protein
MKDTTKVYTQDKSNNSAHTCTPHPSFGMTSLKDEAFTLLFTFVPRVVSCLFSGAIAKLRKATISFVTSVYLSARPHGTTWLSLGGSSK